MEKKERKETRKKGLYQQGICLSKFALLNGAEGVYK